MNANRTNRSSPIKTAYQTATRVFADAMAEALAMSDPAEAMAAIRRAFAEAVTFQPELRALPEIGQHLDRLGMTPDKMASIEASGQLPENMRQAMEDMGLPPNGADRLIAIRVALGLSQAEMGERLGVSYGQVSRWERGVLPIPGEVMRKLLAEWGGQLMLRAPKSITCADVRALRRKFSRQQIAAELGTSAVVVGMWEKDRAKPSPRFAVAIEQMMARHGVERGDAATVGA